MPKAEPTAHGCVAVIGLGYVGLPVALALASANLDTIGFDVDSAKVHDLRRGRDRSGQIDSCVLEHTPLNFTYDPQRLREATCFIIAVPTPIDADRNPDLGPLTSACRTVGSSLRAGSVVVLESTVYPGVTEEICGPILEESSGLKQGTDFKLAYSPERINPGDQEHTLERVVKVVAAEDDTTLERVAAIYQTIVDAGVYRAPSIRVAEAAKVIENTQRDLNIALMNELAIIFDRMGLRTKDVLATAGTKWNFLPFTPGLVGGHCIGVDPYYLTAKAEQLGYHPQVILAGRRINDGVGTFIASKCVKLLASRGRRVAGARVGVLGLTFKENVPDLRNSRVPDIAIELAEYGIDPLVHDPIVNADDARARCGTELREWDELTELDALIVAVPHECLLAQGLASLTDIVTEGGVLIDVKSAFEPSEVRSDIAYWSL